MTDNQAAIKKEIELFHKRLGRYPTVSAIAKIMGKTTGTMSLNIKRMEARGYVEYVGEWVSGQSRQVKAL